MKLTDTNDQVASLLAEYEQMLNELFALLALGELTVEGDEPYDPECCSDEQWMKHALKAMEELEERSKKIQDLKVTVTNYGKIFNMFRRDPQANMIWHNPGDLEENEVLAQTMVELVEAISRYEQQRVKASAALLQLRANAAACPTAIDPEEVISFAVPFEEQLERVQANIAVLRHVLKGRVVGYAGVGSNSNVMKQQVKLALLCACEAQKAIFPLEFHQDIQRAFRETIAGLE